MAKEKERTSPEEKEKQNTLRSSLRKTERANYKLEKELEQLKEQLRKAKQQAKEAQPARQEQSQPFEIDKCQLTFDNSQKALLLNNHKVVAKLSQLLTMAPRLRRMDKRLFGQFKQEAVVALNKWMRKTGKSNGWEVESINIIGRKDNEPDPADIIHIFFKHQVIRKTDLQYLQRLDNRTDTFLMNVRLNRVEIEYANE